jgi:1-acyl-sn-glycerol-3-phosphate acyltransferase
MKFRNTRQSTGFLYAFFAQGLEWVYLGLFKKIHLNNFSSIQVDVPIIFACNHPTAFVDPITLCIYLDPPVYNMTRGDIFRRPFFRRLLMSFNMFPVYRLRDGYADRDRNEEVFEYCVTQLGERRIINIFVEGEHHLDKRIRPLKKGFARIAFAAYERFQQADLQVVPAGFNYVRGDVPRDVSMNNIGKPIYVRDYWDAYVENPSKAIHQLCAAVTTQLHELCFHIPDEADDVLAEQWLTLHRSSHLEAPWPILVVNRPRFSEEHASLKRLNAMSVGERADLRVRCADYFEELNKRRLTDAGLMNPHLGSWRRLFWIILGFLPAALGWAGSFLLLQLISLLTKKWVRKPEFVTSVQLGLGFVLGIPYFLALALWGLFSGLPGWTGLGLLMPLLALFSVHYREFVGNWQEARRAWRHKDRQALMERRGALAGDRRGAPIEGF